MIYVAELDDAEFTQLGDTLVSGFVLEKELEQAHLFTAEKRHFVSLLAGFFLSTLARSNTSVIYYGKRSGTTESNNLRAGITRCAHEFLSSLMKYFCLSLSNHLG